MTIISTEMLKWKRNKTVLGIFILTAILGIFAVERAFSISRSSSLMNSFSDLYTLAFKNLTSLFLMIQPTSAGRRQRKKAVAEQPYFHAPILFRRL